MIFFPGNLTKNSIFANKTYVWPPCVIPLTPVYVSSPSNLNSVYRCQNHGGRRRVKKLILFPWLSKQPEIVWSITNWSRVADADANNWELGSLACPYQLRPAGWLTRHPGWRPHHWEWTAPCRKPSTKGGSYFLKSICYRWQSQKHEVAASICSELIHVKLMQKSHCVRHVHLTHAKTLVQNSQILTSRVVWLTKPCDTTSKIIFK